MKKLSVILLAAVSLVKPALALQNVLTSPIVSGPIASSQTIVTDLNFYKVDYLSLQEAYSTATIAAQNFTDGRASTDTITILSTASLVGQAATNTLTVSTNSALVPTKGGATINFQVNVAGITGFDYCDQWYKSCGRHQLCFRRFHDHLGRGPGGRYQFDGPQYYGDCFRVNGYVNVCQYRSVL